MNTSLLRMAVRLYSNPLATKRLNRHNQRQWLRSVQLLGDNWLLMKKFGRLQTPRD